jgi:translation elongation factor EF-4
MKDNIEDMVKETIEETPLGGKSLSSILDKNTLDKPAKGLASLLTSEVGQPVTQTKTQVQQVTTEFYPTDTAIHNEFLRVEREKNEKLTKTLEKLSDLPDQLHTLQNKLDELTQFEEMNKLDNDINNEISKNNFDLLKEKRNYLYVVMAICLGFGMVLGPMLFSTKEEVKVVKAPAPIVKKVMPIKKLDQFVTTKFVNIRSNNSPKAKVLKTLSPNQLLTKIDVKGGWILVEFKNHINSTTTKGWAWHENLKKVTNP